MILMESRRKIRVLYRKCGSIKPVSRRTGISVPTVRKIIKSEEALEVSYKRSVQQHPKLGRYKEALEKLLRDKRFSKPQRTGKMLFEDLQDLGCRRSYSAVNRYISAWKERTSFISPDACIPLSFAPGEAFQFDWSSEHVISGDEVVSVKVAHFMLCYSGKNPIFSMARPRRFELLAF